VLISFVYLRTIQLSLKSKVFNLLADGIIKGFRLNNPRKIQTHFLERVLPICKLSHLGVDYLFHCPNSIVRWRVETMFTKEPETIDWIDTFKKREVFFDIGANIGLYSVYAAMKGVQVLAFEPDAQNYAELNRNFFLNNLADNAKALCIALSDAHNLDFLYVSNFSAGAALCTFGNSMDWQNQEFIPVFKQSVISYSLDQFIEIFPDLFPNHIKIDVDGLESKIIKGSVKTLKDSRLKSVLVELCENLNEDRQIINQIEFYGLRLMKKERSPLIKSDMPMHSVYNYIFKRK